MAFFDDAAVAQTPVTSLGEEDPDLSVRLLALDSEEIPEGLKDFLSSFDAVEAENEASEVYSVPKSEVEKLLNIHPEFGRMLEVRASESVPTEKFANVEELGTMLSQQRKVSMPWAKDPEVTTKDAEENRNEIHPAFALKRGWTKKF